MPTELDFDPYIALFIAMSVAYVFGMYTSNVLLNKMNTNGQPMYWPLSNRKKYETIKQISILSADEQLKDIAKKYLFCIGLTHYTVVIGLSLFVLMAASGC